MSLATGTPLTDDALVYILKYVAGFSDSDLYEFCHGPACIDNAVALSHVCKRWRRIALGVPHIWTMLTSKRSHPDQVAEQLKRIGSLPLWVECDVEGARRERSLAMLASISQSGAQIEHMNLDFHRRDLVVMLQFLQRPAPRMTSLMLSATHAFDEASPIEGDEWDMRICPQDTLAMVSERELWAALPIHTPALRFLKMERIPWFASGPTSWQCLKELEVSSPGPYYTTDERWCLDLILARLSILPHLTCFTLKGFVRTRQDAHFEEMLLQRAPGDLGCPYGRVVLPNLRELSLELYMLQNVVQFSRCVSIPSDCQIDIYLLTFCPVENYRRHHLYIKHLLPHDPRGRPVHTFTYSDDSDRLSISGIREAVDGKETRVDIEIPCEYFTNEDLPHLALHVWSLFDFAHLRELCMDIELSPGPPPDPQWWELLFDPCANVEILRLEARAIRAFTNYCLDGARRQPPCVMYRRLLKLTCWAIDAEDLQLLNRLLRWRRRAGYGPLQLYYTPPGSVHRDMDIITLDLTNILTGGEGEWRDGEEDENEDENEASEGEEDGEEDDENTPASGP